MKIKTIAMTWRLSTLATALLVMAPVQAASSAICSEVDTLLVPHRDAILPPGFVVHRSQEDGQCTGISLLDDDGGDVALTTSSLGCTAPTDLQPGAYTAIAMDGDDEAPTPFTVTTAVELVPPAMTHSSLRVERVDASVDGCGDVPQTGDTLVRVTFDAEGASTSGWWLKLDVSSDESEALGSSSVLVSPPTAPGSGRGVAVNLGSGHLPREVCGSLSWVSPVGEEQPVEDLGCLAARATGCTMARTSPTYSSIAIAVALLLLRRRTSRLRSASHHASSSGGSQAFSTCMTV